MLIQILIATVTIFVSYLYTKLRYFRFKQYAQLPQFPNDLLFGHLKIMNEFMQRGVPDRHPDKIFEEMWEARGCPPVMLVDFRPINQPMLLVTNYEIAEQVSRPSKLFPLSVTKSPTWSHMSPIIGNTSILGKEGSEWKTLRKIYNPGFTPQHLRTLLPLILEKTEPFLTYLDEFALSGEEFSVETLVSNLTFDVIGAVVLDINLEAQHIDRSQQSEVIRLFWELLRTYQDDKNNFPWWIVPRTTIRRHYLGKRIDNLVRDLIRHKYAEEKERAAGNQSRSILALSFQETEELTAQIISETSDQVRTFLFAGHDSTTGMLQWIFYELSRTPYALAAIRNELDEILGPDPNPAAICVTLAENGEEILPRLRYTNAVIKETLRLHPPASTTRMAKTGAGFTVQTPTGEEYCVDGLIIYSCQSIIQRDPAVYGATANDWMPERWLDEDAKNIPAAAWRPFERGPRNCIGQELANLESRIILAIVARKYDFSKVGIGANVLDEKGLPILNEKGQYKVKSELYNTRRVTSKPVDGTIMKVKLASTA